MKTTPAFTRNAPPTFAHVNGSTVRAAAVMCPRCCHSLHARDIEIIDGDVRATCANCHTDLLTIERQ